MDCDDMIDPKYFGENLLGIWNPNKISFGRWDGFYVGKTYGWVFKDAVIYSMHFGIAWAVSPGGKKVPQKCLFYLGLIMSRINSEHFVQNNMLLFFLPRKPVIYICLWYVVRACLTKLNISAFVALFCSFFFAFDTQKHRDQVLFKRGADML